MSDSGKIAPTAHYTAYCWHVLGLPHAELFATPLGRRLYRAYRLLELPGTLRGRPSKLLRTLKNRHALIDAELERLAPDRIVELGAGLSRRGLTFAADHGVRYLEIDLPEMIAYKARLIEERASAPLKAALAPQLRSLAADIMADDFPQLLARELALAERPVVIAEGVIGYFGPALRLKLLRAVHHALNGRGAMLADLRLHPRGERGSRILRVGQLVATRGRGAAPGFSSPAEIAAMFHAAGFTRVEQLPALEADVLSTVWRADAGRS
jgi:O-methyltransferase involved in polyketide biosynthesis